MKFRILACVALAAATAAACDSPLDTDPTASIDAGTALSTKRGIELGLNGSYRALMGGSLFGRNELFYADMYGDNLDFTGTFQTDREIGLRNITTANTAIRDMWSTIYQAVNNANNVLAAIPTVSELDEATARQYRGEALFLRSLAYSRANLYWAGVPLVLEPTVGISDQSLVARATAQEVWAQIAEDLEEAATLLPTGRANGRATQGAANALLARVYLEDGKYAQARDKATLVINSPNYRLNTNYADNWKVKNSQESIFELNFTANSSNSAAFWFFPQALGGRLGFAPTAALNTAFAAGDTRKAVTICLSGAQRYGCKYTRIAVGDDNIIVLRLAEMYLIRAEANARLGASAATVLADVNIVRARAGLAALDPAVVSTQAALLAAVLAERRFEFVMEGHRFFDLRRHGVAPTVLSIATNRLVFPIPQADRDVNPNLTQNPGY